MLVSLVSNSGLKKPSLLQVLLSVCPSGCNARCDCDVSKPADAMFGAYTYIYIYINRDVCLVGGRWLRLRV